MVISPVQAQRNDIMHLIMKQLLVLTKSLIVIVSITHCCTYMQMHNRMKWGGGMMCKMSIEVIKRFF